MVQDWAYLPEGLVTVISEKLSTNADYVRLRAVCKRWRTDVPPSSSHLPRQAPWLMLPRPAHDVNNKRVANDSVLSFYDPYQSQTHKFWLPYHPAVFIHGSSYGWLILEQDQLVWLYNPINRMEILDLPSLQAPPTFPSDFFYNKQLLWNWTNLCIQKVVLSCNPSNPEGCVVVAMFRFWSIWELGFCRIGDPQWTILKMRICRSSRRTLLDFTFHNNLVYTINARSRLIIYDLHNHAVRTVFLEFPVHHIYFDHINLAEGSTDVLLVTTSQHIQEGMFVVEVFKWYGDSQECLRVTNIANRQIFLGTGQCCDLQLEEAQGNRLYWVKSNYPENSCRLYINWVNLESEVAHTLPDHIEVFSDIFFIKTSWFTPSLM